MLNSKVILGLFLAGIFATSTSAFAQSSEAELHLPVVEIKDEAKTESKWNLGVYMELRSQQSRDQRPVVRNRQQIEEAELHAEVELDPSLRFEASGASEQFSGESEFYLKEAYFNFSQAPRWYNLRLGQKLMSIGLLNELEHSFSSNPGFYQKLWTAKKGIDLGAELELYPLEDQLLFLKASFYSGQIVRPGDQRLDTPDQAPRELSLRSRSKYHEAFLSRFEQDLAFIDPILANGVGVNVTTSDLLPYDFELGFFSEYWDMTEIQAAGPNENTIGYFVFPTVRWRNFKLGYRYGETQTAVGPEQNRVDLPNVISRLARAEVALTPHFNIMAEQVNETSDRVLKDELVVRAVIDWSLH